LAELSPETGILIRAVREMAMANIQWSTNAANWFSYGEGGIVVKNATSTIYVRASNIVPGSEFNVGVYSRAYMTEASQISVYANQQTGYATINFQSPGENGAYAALFSFVYQSDVGVEVIERFKISKTPNAKYVLMLCPGETTETSDIQGFTYVINKNIDTLELGGTGANPDPISLNIGEAHVSPTTVYIPDGSSAYLTTDNRGRLFAKPAIDGNTPAFIPGGLSGEAVLTPGRVYYDPSSVSYTPGNAAPMTLDTSGCVLIKDSGQYVSSTQNAVYTQSKRPTTAAPNYRTLVSKRTGSANAYPLFWNLLSPTSQLTSVIVKKLAFSFTQSTFADPGFALKVGIFKMGTTNNTDTTGIYIGSAAWVSSVGVEDWGGVGGAAKFEIDFGAQGLLLNQGSASIGVFSGIVDSFTPIWVLENDTLMTGASAYMSVVYFPESA
jgi:hypothetical protein